MILVKPSHTILAIMRGEGYLDPLRLIEVAGRTCYKSEEKITDDSARKFVQNLNNLGHHSVIEHSCMTVKFVCDRGVSHELVRHRLASYSQESTRYCDYSSDHITFIIPCWLSMEEGIYDAEDIEPTSTSSTWLNSMLISEESYKWLIRNGWTAQHARSVLPNSLKTEVVMTANFREWQHVFNLRTSKAAHPQMRELMLPLQDECKERFPEIFGEL